jgi:hypothetical protein
MVESQIGTEKFHWDKQPSVSSDPGEGGTLAGLRKVSCRLLFAAE